MGAAKFPEEIVERYVESYNGLESPPDADGALALSVKPKLMYCPLCFAGFLEETALDKHIAGNHGKQHVYLKVNDQIIRDVCWVKNPIKECTLVILKIESVEVSIDMKGHSKRFQINEVGDGASLLEHIPQKIVDEVIKIDVHAGRFSRSYTLYQGKQPTFRSDRLDDAIRGMLEPQDQGREIDLVGLREACRGLGLNALEGRYLDGILEYYHGTRLEVEGRMDLARPRLESAMDLLMPFCTPIAEQLRDALALRMNCFAGQWNCPEESAFWIAERFFCAKYQGDMAAEVLPSKCEPSIWIDPTASKILQALCAFRADNDRGVFSILNSVNVRDRNDEDKVTLIEARTKARMGDVRGALAAYKKFVDHPIFGEEAERYKSQHSA
jgi:hypothetical protein